MHDLRLNARAELQSNKARLHVKHAFEAIMSTVVQEHRSGVGVRALSLGPRFFFHTRICFVYFRENTSSKYLV